ncbi:MAG: hypothetical protein R2682_05315 [Pyrinomonadaceae bacterium]
MRHFYYILSCRQLVRSIGLLGILLLIPIITMAQDDGVTIAVRLPSDGVKIAKGSEAKVTVTVTNISDHEVEIGGPYFSMLREGVSKQSMRRCDSFVGRIDGGDPGPAKYSKLKSGEARSFDFDLGKLFVMEGSSSINWFSPLLKTVGGGRYDTISEVYVIYKAEKSLVSSRSFKVDVAPSKTAWCGKVWPE